MIRVIANLNFLTITDRDNFKSDLETQLDGMDLAVRSVNAGETEEGTPITNVDVTHNRESESNTHFDYIQNDSTWTAGEATLHECNHTLGGEGTHDCKEVIDNSGRKYTR